MNEYFGPLHDLLERKRQEPLLDRLYSAVPSRIRIVMAGIAGVFSMACAAVAIVLPWPLHFFFVGFGASVLMVGIINAFAPMYLVSLEWTAEKLMPKDE